MRSKSTMQLNPEFWKCEYIYEDDTENVNTKWKSVLFKSRREIGALIKTKKNDFLWSRCSVKIRGKVTWNQNILFYVSSRIKDNVDTEVLVT